MDELKKPDVTYIGTDTKIPNPGAGEDPYGSPNYWAISGGFSDDYKMSGNVYSGTQLLADQIRNRNSSDHGGYPIFKSNFQTFT